MGKQHKHDALEGWDLVRARTKVHPAPGVRAEWASKPITRANIDPNCEHLYQVRGTALWPGSGDGGWYCAGCGKPV